MVYPYAGFVQFLSHPGAVGIDYLPDKQLIPDGYNTSNNFIHIN
jgi:hypothetical protein